MPASTAIEKGEYRFTKENGPFLGEHRVVIGIETEPNAAEPTASNAGPQGGSSGIKVAPPPEKEIRPQRAGPAATISRKTQWELQYRIEENGDDRKDFELSG